jgi:hypothetical protein
MHAFRHEDVARLAHQFWEDRGCPFGSSEVDWFRAEQELQARPETAEPVGNTQASTASPRSRKAHVQRHGG